MKFLWHRYDFVVDMIPVEKDLPNRLGLNLQTKKKHWDHITRRAIVVAKNPACDLDVEMGDVVVFSGSAGFTLDADIHGDDVDDYGPNQGLRMRWLKANEIEAVDERETQRRRDDANAAYELNHGL